MSKRKKMTLRWILTSFIALLLSWIAVLRTDGFDPSVLAVDFSNQEIECPSEVQAIFNEPFTYLGKGRQSFVFESADKKNVIKFFNQSYFKLPWYFFLTGEKEKIKRSQRKSFYETSYHLAKEAFGEQILYIHLGKTQLLPTLKVIDRASRVFLLDLNQVAFVIQKKGVLLYEHLQTLANHQKYDEIQEVVDQFLDAVSSRIAIGIADADSDVAHNWGVIDGKVFHLDPGRLYYHSNLNVESEFSTATRKFRKWLCEFDPEVAKYFNLKQKQSISKVKQLRNTFNSVDS